MMPVATYLNSEFVGDVPCEERLRSICFKPIHYFFGGTTRVIKRDLSTNWEELWESYYESYPAAQHNYLIAFKMVILIVPSLVVGLIAAIVVYVERSFHAQRHLPNLWRRLSEQEELPFYIQADKEMPFAAPHYELLNNISQTQSHQTFLDLSDRWIAFISKLKSADCWENPAVRLECSQFIEDAYKEMYLLFQHAAKVANRDPERMAHIMFELTPVGDNNSRGFFYRSITSMYFSARLSLYYFKKEDNGRYTKVYPDLNSGLVSWSQSKSFFTPSTPEYRWRRLYNSACDLIDAYPGLRKALSKQMDPTPIPDYTPSRWPSDWHYDHPDDLLTKIKRFVASTG